MTEIKPFYNKKATCLLCQHNFTTKRIRSRFVKVTQYDTDFRPIYESEQHNPILYQVKVCPECGFSFTKDFSPYFPPQAKEMIANKITKNWTKQDYGDLRTVQDAINTYLLGAYCGTLKNEKHITIAGLYMRLAWLYRSLENDEQELRFTKLAFNEYGDSYSVADFQGTQMSEVRLLYILGDLARRSGEQQTAIQYFSRVVEKRSSTTETGIIDMARERWHDIRDEMKSAEQISNEGESDEIE